MGADTFEKQTTEDLNTVSSWLLIAFFLGWCALVVRIIMVGIAIHMNLPAFRSTSYSGLSVQTSTAFVWTLAWETGGFLFGFIFGIPKVIAATTSATNPALNDPSQVASPKLKVNTNLEDISDWLTKILVGATLTQIVKIPSAIGHAATFMAVQDTGSVSFNAALLVYYSALGFLSGYILTRMFFARAFAMADQGPTLSPEAVRALDSTTVGFERVGFDASTDASLRKAAFASDAIPITETLSGDQALRLAKGATVTGDTSRALTASKLAAQKLPDDPQAQLTYAWSLYKSGAAAPETILAIVSATAQKLSDTSDPAILSSVYASLAYLWLYQPPPRGYDNALQALAQYDAKKGLLDADIEINRACAFGQKYSYLSNVEGGPTGADALRERNQARAGALEAVKQAISVDASARSRLREILWVTADPQDNDLSSFQDDVEFTVLLPRT